MAKVQLEGNQTDGYHLILDGAPFFVKGAGLEFGLLESLANAGGNTFRTWRVENGMRDAIGILDEAGEYWLFCQVDASHQTSAVINIPFLIKPKPQQLERFSTCSERKPHEYRQSIDH